LVVFPSRDQKTGIIDQQTEIMTKGGTDSKLLSYRRQKQTKQFMADKAD